MKRWILMLGVVTALLTFAIPAKAVVIDFDDFTTTSSYAAIPASYKGFNWSGQPWYAVHDNYYATYGNTYGSPSGKYAAFNGGGVLNIALLGGGMFDFNGAFFTGWASGNGYASYTSTSITVTGYKGGVLVGSATMSLSANKYDWLAANLFGIDKLIFTGSGSSKWWLMDNFTINEKPIPEPATLSLMGLGLTGLAAYRRRRKA